MERFRRAGVGEVLLMALVVAIVAMMVVPLPTWLLDVLISTNLTCAVVLLMVALYVGDAMKIAAFPTILLLTTLYRLALNVSSTRLILLQADAGKVIQSFGSAVVRNDLVVGVIIFLVITIVQYVVIARGAERVAEVAARFTLDAMPGKQMAIDADLRAGAIDQGVASRRRTLLGRESQLYGAMDGAMKFVKGDAIAGILIAIISIVGGLIVGYRQGWDLEHSFRVYSLLTIGDALVSQIPALVISTAAALIVTRVASEDEGAHLSKDIATQVLAHPRALGVAAFVLALLGVAPGMPLVPFLALAAVTAGAAFWAAARQRRAAASAGVTASPPPAVSVEAIGGVDGDALAARLYEELGVLAQVQVRVVPGVSGWRLLLGEVPVARGDDPQAVWPALRRRAGELLGIQETRALLDALDTSHPALVRETVPRLVALPVLAETLRRLVDEQVSIRDLRAILEAVAEAPAGERDADALVERVRSALRRQITWQVTKGEPTLQALLLDTPIEDAIREAVTRTKAGAVLALEPEISRDIVAAVGRAAAGKPAVLLTAAPIRRFTRRLVEHAHPELAVVSYDELEPEVKIQPTGRVSV